MMRTNFGLLCWAFLIVTPVQAEEPLEVLRERCVSCHNEDTRKGGLSLASATGVREGGETGAAIVAGDADSSLMIEMISGDSPEMPKDAEPLTDAQIQVLRTWVNSGSEWPADLKLSSPEVTDLSWWSLQPLSEPPLPKLRQEDVQWARTPVDHFIVAALREKDLTPAKEADRRVLIRRLYFDLLGLPPDYKSIEKFVNDPSPNAYESLVDRLLDSPHYGERWARHWLDVVHYGDTHGYDKDKPRPNAWPYRDYVIRSFNEDKPYSRFVQEQIAGDVLWPETTDGLEATGFISAGPWDFIGHAEVPETKIDGKVARHLDRDDMVSSTMNTFCSLTVQCARCHNHKFDPVSQRHYYSLQSVFAALDRADRKYDRDSAVAKRRRDVELQRRRLESELKGIDERIARTGGPQLLDLNQKLERIRKTMGQKERPEFGYHSEISAKQQTEKWVQVDLGESIALDRVTIVGCRDDFAGIGEGFGFPVRFRIELSNEADFEDEVVVVADETDSDFANPSCAPVSFDVKSSAPVRYVRVTATKLVERKDDFIFALAELQAFDSSGANVARGAIVTALDSIEAPVRWQRVNLVDGYYYGLPSDPDAVAEIDRLERERSSIIERLIPKELYAEQEVLRESLSQVEREQNALPKQDLVYCGTVHTGSGTFRGTGHDDGRPREIRILHRGDILSPGDVVAPGTVPLIAGMNWQFELPDDHAEGDRRIALANWLVSKDNPLTWRSIVNRVWQYHIGRGIVDSPNDFGRMGRLPTHPQLLDWLAVHFRDQGQSFKSLHRMIVCSSVYRQRSNDRTACADVDADNRLLWRMNRRALDAESIRDAVLSVSGKLQSTLYGPPFQDFVVERPEHSPHYEYHLHDPNDSLSHRRSVYRFLVRSQQQPFMQTLDCADPSESVAKRNTTLTSLQALAMLNNKFMVAMSEHFADRIRKSTSDVDEQIRMIHRDALGRDPSASVMEQLLEFERRQGLAYVCRVIMNLNEFVFVD